MDTLKIRWVRRLRLSKWRVVITGCVLFLASWHIFSYFILSKMTITTSLDTATPLPTLYEYYTSGGIVSGLNADKSYFTLNEKNITLYSGAMHYFRTPKELWRDRLRKMRAAGLNAVETYVPWNLHEPEPGKYDFGDGGTDMQDFLDIKTFLKTAQEEDLLAIIRPGPYICAEWEFGGFPSWLLTEPMQLRTSDKTYMKHVKRYFNVLLPILAALQFINGGPLLAFQVENEYGSTYSTSFTPDKVYLTELRQIFLDNNITSVLFTADGVTSYRDLGTLPKYFFVTANFNGNPNQSFEMLETIQPNRPKMAMEYYPGWFDHWSETHHSTSALNFIANLELVLKYPGSFNLYMMHGGTSYGFMNGANLANSLTDNSGYQPDTTSYDYNVPILENGDYHVKYSLLKSLLSKYAEPKTKLPDPPAETRRVAYANITIQSIIPLKKLIDEEKLKFVYNLPQAMEFLPINNNWGQSYGSVVYRKEGLDLTAGSVLRIEGHICDTLLVLVNGKLVSPILEKSSDLDNFGFWRMNVSTLVLNHDNLTDATLDLVVENWGRVGYGKLDQYLQYKGLWQNNIYINGKFATGWKHVSLQFKKSWTDSLTIWNDIKLNGETNGPGLYKGYFTTDHPNDTYMDMRGWKKGIVIVNGFVLGRYARIGPQQCLYLPAPFIRSGQNQVVIFEHYKPSDKVVFAKDPIYETI